MEPTMQAIREWLNRQYEIDLHVVIHLDLHQLPQTIFWIMVAIVWWQWFL
jgi:hypothetical protein